MLIERSSEKVSDDLFATVTLFAASHLYPTRPVLIRSSVIPACTGMTTTGKLRVKNNIVHKDVGNAVSLQF